MVCLGSAGDGQHLDAVHREALMVQHPMACQPPSSIDWQIVHLGLQPSSGSMHMASIFWPSGKPAVYASLHALYQKRPAATPHFAVASVGCDHCPSPAAIMQRCRSTTPCMAVLHCWQLAAADLASPGSSCSCPVICSVPVSGLMRQRAVECQTPVSLVSAVQCIFRVRGCDWGLGVEHRHQHPRGLPRKRVRPH